MLTQEIGHTLGLDDNNTNPRSVMNRASPQTVTPDRNDVAALQYVYGPPP